MATKRHREEDALLTLIYLSDCQPPEPGDNPYKKGTHHAFVWNYLSQVLSAYTKAKNTLKGYKGIDHYDLCRNSVRYYNQAIGTAKHLLSHLRHVSEETGLTQKAARKRKV